MLISIIIPVYNRESLILNSLKSVQRQTHAEWECIVVDDNSTDRTVEVVEDLMKEDKRFRCIVNTNKKGAQGARNTGIKYAKSDWIAFNDSDDEWMPEKLEKQIAILNKNELNPCLVIHTNCMVNETSLNSIVKWELPYIEGERPFKILLKTSSPMFQGLITSAFALKQINYLDENVPSYQEWDTAIGLSKICNFVHIKEPLFIYNKHNGETISKDIKRDIEGSNYIRLKYRKDYIEQYDEYSFQQALLQNIYRSIGSGYWDFGMGLLNKAKAFIPQQTFWYWMLCFKLKLDPLHGKKNNTKNILKRFKRKIYD
ncbi:MAG TPA: glycosyltransferase family 2 protein [Hanamia sp.]